MAYDNLNTTGYVGVDSLGNEYRGSFNDLGLYVDLNNNTHSFSALENDMDEPVIMGASPERTYNAYSYFRLQNPVASDLEIDDMALDYLNKYRYNTTAGLYILDNAYDREGYLRYKEGADAAAKGMIATGALMGAPELYAGAERVGQAVYPYLFNANGTISPFTLGLIGSTTLGEGINAAGDYYSENNGGSGRWDEDVYHKYPDMPHVLRSVPYFADGIAKGAYNLAGNAVLRLNLGLDNEMAAEAMNDGWFVSPEASTTVPLSEYTPGGVYETPRATIKSLIPEENVAVWTDGVKVPGERWTKELWTWNDLMDGLISFALRMKKSGNQFNLEQGYRNFVNACNAKGIGHPTELEFRRAFNNRYRKYTTTDDDRMYTSNANRSKKNSSVSSGNDQTSKYEFGLQEPKYTKKDIESVLNYYVKAMEDCENTIANSTNSAEKAAARFRLNALQNEFNKLNKNAYGGYLYSDF